MPKHLLIPDTQVKPGQSYDHLRWAGQYAADKKPDVIIHCGDHWDMPSLSSYDVGKKSFEGRRYVEDINAGINAMRVFLEPIHNEQKRLKDNKKKQWNPRMVFTLGNHENRITRAIEDDPKIEGLISFDDLMLPEMGWEVHGFLKPVVIDGVCYAHYHCSGVMGRAVSSAPNMLNKLHMSTVMGHVQDRQIAFAKRADGKRITGIFAGIYYCHDEDYLNPQTNNSWRGIWMLHEVDDGQFDEMPVSLSFLERMYGEKDE
tara:strand:- start:156 stop:932 length:777 start_codon:yes stop_codon:yes gene_type:complete